MKRMLIDLNVVTIGSWKKVDPARAVAEIFMKKVEGHEGEAKQFYVVTPYVLLELVNKWKDKALAGLIKDFYQKVTDEYVEKIEVMEELFENFEDVYNALIGAGVKPEDAFLVMVCSVKRAVLVTFDKKHLRGKKEGINSVLREYGCEEVEVMLPEEYLSLEFGGKPSNLAVIFKDSFAHSSLYLISKLNGVNIFRDDVFGISRALLCIGAHAINSNFLIYKPFGENVCEVKGVFWAFLTG